MNQERLIREREFHDHVFADDTRKCTDKYYSVAQIEYELYRGILDAKVPGSRFLEYGCGPYGYVYDAARQTTQAAGIDISEVAIRMAHEKASSNGLSIDFRVMDAENMDFANESFDVICGNSILHHLDLNRSFSELARVMAPQGMGVFIEPMGHNPVINHYRTMTPNLRTSDEHPLLMKDLAKLKQFFQVVQVRHFHVLTLLAVPFRNRPVFRSLRTVLHAIDQSVFWLVPWLKRYSWMALIEFSGPRPDRPQYAVRNSPVQNSACTSELQEINDASGVLVLPER